ncbi:hypothetical protein [Cupriavidus necator]
MAQMASESKTVIENGYIVDIDVLQLTDGSWSSIVSLKKVNGGDTSAEHFRLGRTFTDKAFAFSYTLAVMRACVREFVPASAASIAKMLKHSEIAGSPPIQ